MERSSKRSRSATKVSSKVGKRTHRSKSAAVSKHNRAVQKTSAARALANAVTMGFMGIEKKFLDTARTPNAVGTAAALTGGEQNPSTGCTGCLSCPAQGDTEQSRDGKRIVITSVQVKGTIRRQSVESSLAPGEDDSVFVALVQDTQSNGAQCNSEDIYKSLGAAVHLNVAPTRNLLFANRFRVLKSERINMDYPTLASAAANDYATNAINREIDWYVPLQMPVNFNAGTTSSIANVIDKYL